MNRYVCDAVGNRRISSIFSSSSVRFAAPQKSWLRNASSKSASPDDLVLIDLNEDTCIGTLTMNRPPANSLSLEMLQALSNAIQEANVNPSTQALVVSSSLSKIFCAGLDLSELYQPDADRLPQFWSAFQQVYLDWYGPANRLATLAAIGGHAPAAGCMIALSCDYRIMTNQSAYRIGLNESLLGIVAPPWLGQQYIDTIGHRPAELALSLGTLFDPHAALEKGLVDELIVDGEENVLDVATQRAAQWVAIPPQARMGAKELTRGRHIQQLLEHRQADSDHFCNFVTQETVQANLGKYLEQLAKRKKK